MYRIHGDGFKVISIKLYFESRVIDVNGRKGSPGTLSPLCRLVGYDRTVNPDSAEPTLLLHIALVPHI